MNVFCAILVAYGIRTCSGLTVFQGSSVFLRSSFQEYVIAYDRSYRDGSEEYATRRALFERREREVVEHNQNPNRLWSAGLNHLTDRTGPELEQIRGWRRTPSASGSPSLLAVGAVRVASLPKEVDWRNTTSAKNVADQGACGSCWAVATAKMLEAHWEIHQGSKKPFSAQELVNCVPNPKECGGSGGCSGATVELAMKYVQAHGLTTTEETPYLGSDQTCKKAPASLAAGVGGKQQGLAGMESWSTLPSNKAGPLMDALQRGPVAISAAADAWMMYSHGVFDACEKDAVIDHAILLVGYGTDKGTNYWTVQNSWGNLWGEAGFIRIKRGATAAEDDAHCGTDSRPGDGISCKPYPDKVTVCGMCGILYDSVSPKFVKTSLMQTQSHSNSLLERSLKSIASLR